MDLDLSDLQFHGPAFPEPFVKFELEKELSKLNLLSKTTGREGEELDGQWDTYRRKLRMMSTMGGALHVQSHVVEPILQLLGYSTFESSEPIKTTEEQVSGESGGVLLVSHDGKSKLRLWSASYDEDLYAPTKRGRAYRYSHLRIAQRVLKSTGERLGVLSNGVEIIIVISEPARIDSTITFSVDPDWKRSRTVPDSFRFFLALCSPNGVAALSDLIDKARLQQTRVTKELRVQARQAVERFAQEILDHPANREWYNSQTDKAKLAKELWHEGLVTIYRLLFILKLEASDDPARVFSFASNSLWRNTFSPSMALAPFSQEVLNNGADSGSLLEAGMKTLFKMFEQGCVSTELNIKPLGGALFGENATPHLSALTWGERAVAHILDRLLWTPKKRGADTRERVHYGSLDVEDLGRVYEALLELDAGITTEPMCRLRRQKLEVVVPVVQGEKYRPKAPVVHDELTDDDTDDEEIEEEEAPKGKKTKVEWIEEIPPERFFLRVGLGRKATGSFYTPHSFVKFLVQETINPLLAEHSPADDPKPIEMLRLKIVDIAMGSGHFLAEACRYLGAKLYEACRYCDEKALEAERNAEESKKKEDRLQFTEEAREWRQRIIDLPDPEDEILMYLPSRSTEGEESGFSQKKAEALCRRLVATHCLYGVDKNPLAVELAKLVLWIEAHAEGMPLTFLDHRLVVGDSLTGAFWHHLTRRPSNPKQPIEHLFANDLDRKVSEALRDAIRAVGELDASVGTSVADMENKKRIKAEIDRALLPFRVVAAAWSGGVMLGREGCDDQAYEELLLSIAKTGELPDLVTSPKLLAMIYQGLGINEIPVEDKQDVSREHMFELVNGTKPVPAISLDLAFPEVFYPNGEPFGRRGFHIVLGNPPWDAVRPKAKEFFASFEFDILSAPTKRERTAMERRLRSVPEIGRLHDAYVQDIDRQNIIHEWLFRYQVAIVNDEKTGGDPDLAKLFLERFTQISRIEGMIGCVVPSAFHANEGATGLRRLYFNENCISQCYSFENKKQLFEIHRSFKFVTLVVKTGFPTKQFKCCFYLHDDDWLFDEKNDKYNFTMDFVAKTGGEHLSLLELRSKQDLDIAELCFQKGESFGKICVRLNIRLGREMHMTDDAWRFVPTESILPVTEDPREPDVMQRLQKNGYLVLHEGKTFWHYDDRWGVRPKYLVESRAIADKTDWLVSAGYFRLAYRAIQNAENERTFTMMLFPPASVFSNSAPCDRSPQKGKNVDRLVLLSVCSSFSPDWLLRLKATANVNLFILNSLPLPVIKDTSRKYLAHSALRLVCKHSGYISLWQEQVGTKWTEVSEYRQFPLFTSPDQHWDVRSGIDAVVADTYGLNRDQYEHVLSSFSHSSYPKAPKLCLAKFDELKSMGLEAFTRKYDPYWDVPLNEALPKPVIEIVGVHPEESEQQFVLSNEPPKKGKSKNTRNLK
jgi:hypothetical protein